VTGEALIDLVLTSDGDLRGHPGGGPYNVTRALARVISRDPLGNVSARADARGGDLPARFDTFCLGTLGL
jgi:sugar/nucleoside kinase (ribokinase family)